MEEVKGLVVVSCVLLAAVTFFNGFLFARHAENDSKEVVFTIFIVTFASFLIHNFWIFILLLSLYFIYINNNGYKITSNFIILFCISPFIGRIVPGFAGINQFIELNPFILLCLISIPIFLKRSSFKFNYVNSQKSSDLAVFIFVFILILLSFRSESITDGMRNAATRSIVVLVPYFMFSRMLLTTEQLVKVIYAYVLIMFCFSCVAVLETIWGWHFYAPILHNWEDTRVISQYLERAGYLRAYTSVYGPIALGYLFALATGLCLSIKSHVGSTMRVLTILVMLLAGIAATLSRGPLLGSLAIVFIFLFLNSSIGKRFNHVVLPISLAGVFVAGTGQVARIVELLPVIGGVDHETIEYRNQLLGRTFELIWRYPLLGSESFRSDLAGEGLVQGQGIVDVVNTYLSILLNFGFVGLGGFVMIWITVAFGLQRALARSNNVSPDLNDLCSGLLSTLIGCLLIIATTSSVRHVPGMYWILAGISVSSIRIVFSKTEEKKI